MSQLPIDTLTARLGTLPIHHDDEHWEVDLVAPPLPAMARAGESLLASLRAAVCVSTGDAAGLVPPSESAAPDNAFALRAVAACALDAPGPGVSPIRYLPAAVHVRTLPPAMLEMLRGTLEPLGVRVEVKSELPIIEEFSEAMAGLSRAADEMGERPEPPAALMESPGMTLDRVRAFATAAAVFHAAKPWRASPNDLWQIHASIPDPAFSLVTAMGSSGAEFGIGFFRSMEEYQRMADNGKNPAAFWTNNKDTIWSVTFDDLDEAIPNDALLWERERLPKAGKNLLPVPLGAADPTRMIRPDPPMLTFMEGILRAMARLEAKHIRDGKLAATVQTFDGPLKVELVRVEAPDPTQNRPAKAVGGYQMKVTIKGSKPPIWRRLVVRDDATLEELHYAIQIAFGWSNDHLHQFTVDGDRFVGSPGGEASIDEDEAPSYSIVLRELGFGPKSKLLYTYDFGDSWEHAILVEKVLSPSDLDETMNAAAGWKLDEGHPTPIAACTDGKRAGPIEDCGGIWGYADLCAIIAHPSHPEHEERKEWLESFAANSPEKGFDPERYDLAAINLTMKKLVV